MAAVGTGGVLRAVDAVTVNVPDLDRDLRFYRGVLGHELKWRNDTPGQAGLRVPGADTEIVLTIEHRYEPNWLVDSVDDVVESFRVNDGTVLAEPFEIPTGRLAVVGDPFGNVLVLIELTGRYQTDSGGNVTGVA